MLGNKFETWLADAIFDKTLLVFFMHPNNLGYLEDRSSYITELLDGGMKGLIFGLDHVVAI